MTGPGGGAGAWPELGRGDVHVWRASLDVGAGALELLRRTLSPDERGRADRFVHPDPRTRYVVGRGLLRLVLAGYARMKPGALRFAYGPQGKPSLAVDSGPTGLRFNASRSGDLALFALARDREVGVDLERVRPEHADGIGPEFFSAQERRGLASLVGREQARALFACWARKEALAKAVGTGLASPLSTLDVWDPRAPVTLNGSAGGRPSTWILHDLDISPTHAAAVAAEAPDWRLQAFTLRPEFGEP